MEYLVAVRDQARAAGDAETLALLREISRLHWVLLKTNQVISLMEGAYSDTSGAGMKELRAILEKEPLIVKRKADWARDFPKAKVERLTMRPPEEFDR